MQPPAWTFLIPWIPIIFGWVALFFLQRYKDHRDAIRGMITQLEKEVSELRNMAMVYHTSERAENKERDILFELHIVCTGVQTALAQLDLDRKDAVDQIVKLRRSITAKHFHSEHIGALKITDPILGQIDEAVTSVRLTLRHAYVSTLSYWPRLWWRRTTPKG